MKSNLFKLKLLKIGLILQSMNSTSKISQEHFSKNKKSVIRKVCWLLPEWPILDFPLLMNDPKLKASLSNLKINILSIPQRLMTSPDLDTFHRTFKVLSKIIKHVCNKTTNLRQKMKISFPLFWARGFKRETKRLSQKVLKDFHP